MNCRKVDSLISAYVDGELSGSEMLELRQHISSCRTCSSALEAERHLRRMMSELPDPQPTSELESRLHAAVFAPPAPRLPVRHLAFFGAAAATAAACAFFFFHQSSVSNESRLAQEPRLGAGMDFAYTDSRDPLGVYVPVMTVSVNTEGSPTSP